MGTGRKRKRQESLCVATQELPQTKGHIFYDRVNRFSTRSDLMPSPKRRARNSAGRAADRPWRRAFTSGCCWSDTSRD